MILSAPALWFVTAVILEQSRLGSCVPPLPSLLSDAGSTAVFNFVSPWLFLGGMLAVLALNLAALVRAGHLSRGGALQGRAWRWNAALLVTVLLVALKLAGYALLENWQCLIGRAASC